MTFTDDELIEIIEDVTLTFGEYLLNHRQLKEASFESQGIEQTQSQIEKKKQEVERLRDRLRKSRDAVKRRRELEQIRKRHEQDSAQSKRPQTETMKKTSGIETIIDNRGRVVGFRQLANKQVTYMNRRGTVVAREIGGQTFDGKGRYFGRGEQGLRALGRG